MPEMADVEVLKRRFNEELKGETFTAVKILNPALVKTDDLEKKITGRKILEARRYGKYLFIQTGGQGWLIMHFGLTGRLIFEKEKEKTLSSDAMLVLSTASCDLIYEAARVFGMVSFCADPEVFIKEKKMGPDAGAVSEADFIRILRPLKGAVKPALMDQHKIAGIGNVYADEILFQAKIHPQESVKNLTQEQLRTLYEQIHRVHQAAVKVGAVRTQMPEWAIMRVRKTTKKCPACSGKLQMMLTVKEFKKNNRNLLFLESVTHIEK